MKNIKWFMFGVVFALLSWFIADSINLNADTLRIMLKEITEGRKATQILIIGRANNAIGLDPSVVTDEESVKVAVNLFDNLVKHDRNGTSVMPSIAESWQISEDARVWTFFIRKDIVFHDGTKLDAEAIAFNFRRWMDSTSPYHTGHFSYWKFNFGGFPGIVETVKPLSAYVLEIRLSEPYAPFLNTIAMPAFGIASPEAIMTYNEGLKTNPVGSGPFIFDSWSNDGVITLKRNSNYWGEKAKVDQLIFKTIPNEADRIAALTRGEIHIADPIGPDKIALLEAHDNLRILKRPFFNIGYLAINQMHPLLQKNEVRLAIAQALNRQHYIKEAFDDSTRLAQTFIPPVLWGHHEGIQGYSYNPDAAKKNISKVDLMENDPLKFLVMNESRAYFPNPVLLAELIKEDLEAIGIRVDLTIQSWEEVIKLSKLGEYDLLLAGWNGDVADPDNFLYTFFSSENANLGLVSNYSFYKNERVDLLLKQARQTNDQQFRISLYREVQEILFLDIPAIPLVHTMPHLGINSQINGYIPRLSGVEPLNHINFKVGELW